MHGLFDESLFYEKDVSGISRSKYFYKNKTDIVSVLKVMSDSRFLFKTSFQQKEHHF